MQDTLFGNVASVVNQQLMFVMEIPIFVMPVMIAIHSGTRITVHRVGHRISAPYLAGVKVAVTIPCHPMVQLIIITVLRSRRNKFMDAPGVDHERAVMIIALDSRGVQDLIIC